MTKGIFRPAALARLSSPEELDRLLQVTTPRGWLALAGIGVLLLTAVLWSLFGKLPTKLPGQQCMLLKHGGVGVLTTAASGRLSDLSVEVGDRVASGQIVGRLEQGDLLKKIHAAETRLREVQAQYEQARAIAGQGELLRAATTRQQRQGLADHLASARQRTGLLRERIATQGALLEQGLIARQTLIASQLELTAAQLDEQNVLGQFKQLDVTVLEANKQSGNELVLARNALEDARRNLDLMVRETRDFNAVISPYSGRVLEIKASEGQLVERGTPLLSIEASGIDANEIEAYLYLPALDGKKVARGMRVEISPSTAKREEFGFLPAFVSAVADYPSTDQGLMRVFGNDKLVQQLSGAQAPIQIRAALKPSSANVSRYQWSTRDGPPFPLQSGTSCSALITIAEQRPIELLIPLLKKAAGLD